MSTNPFKAFIPYTVTGFSDFLDDDDLDEDSFASVDPSGGQWATVGLVPAIEHERPVIDLQGAGTLMAVRFNERILPGKVRDEMVAKEVLRLEASQGRKVSKKEYAQLRDHCEFALLPKAFIRRTVVPVIFTQEYMLVCTSSQRRADDAVAALITALGDQFVATLITCKRDMRDVLTTMATDGSRILDGDVSFYSDDSVVLKGEDKRTVRIKDKDISDADVQAFLSEAYEAVELGVSMHTGGEEKMSFVVNTGMCFKRIDNIGVKMGKGEDFFQFALLCTQAYRQMLRQWIEVCGGIVESVETTTNTDDGDEL